MSEKSSSNSKNSTNVLIIILATLALSLVSLVAAVSIFETNPYTASFLLVIGFIAMSLSAYVLLQSRRHVANNIDRAAGDTCCQLVDHAAIANVDHASRVVDVVAGGNAQVRSAGATDVDDTAVGGGCHRLPASEANTCR